MSDRLEEIKQRTVRIRESTVYNAFEKRLAADVAWLLSELAAAQERAERAEAAVSEALDELVDRWHESKTVDADYALSYWMGMTDDEYARFVREGPAGYISVIADRSVSAGRGDGG